MSTKALLLSLAFICLALLKHLTESKVQEFWYRVGFSRDIEVNGQYSVLSNVFTVGACGFACGNQAPCLSFGFQAETRTCLLYDRLVESPDNGTLAPKTRYFWNTTCPTELGYSLLSGVCYKIHLEARTWFDANDTCASEGGRLFVGNTMEKMAFLKRLPPKYYALGGTDIAVEGNWQWLNGDPVKMNISWTKNQPDNTNNSDCLYLQSSYLLDDASCTITKISICEFLM